MKRTAIRFIIIAICILFLAAPKVQASIVLFLLVGAIPGTSFSVPPLVMLLSSLTLLALVVHWIRKQHFHTHIRTHLPPSNPVQTKASRRSAAKRRLARLAQTV